LKPINKRLRELEKKVVTSIPKTATKIDLDSLPKAEQELHRCVFKILVSKLAKIEEAKEIAKNNPSILIDNPDLYFDSFENKIIVRSFMLFFNRTFNMFKKIITGLFF